MLRNTRETYGLVAQLLHWATAALIIVLLPLGVFMYDLPDSSGAEVAYKAWFYSLHKTLGVTVFTVAVLRIIWAVFQPHPRPLHADRKLESLAAQTVHWMLYGAIICMPLTGWLHHSASEGFAPIWWPLPQDLPLVPKNPQLAMALGVTHYFTAILLGLALVLHIGGALKHVVIDKDATLRRMIPGSQKSVPADLSEPHFKRLPVFLAALAFVGLGAVSIYDAAKHAGDGVRTQTALAPAEATGWLVDTEKSKIAIEIVQMGNPVAGGFDTWTAAITFDPDNLDAASVEVEVDVASISLGGVADQARGPNFLNAVAHPIARFVSESFASTGENTYEARGQLTLAGRSQPLTLPFTLKIENGRAFVEAAVTLERLAYGIGEKGFEGEGQLGFGVQVKVTLEAEKAPGS